MRRQVSQYAATGPVGAPQYNAGSLGSSLIGNLSRYEKKGGKFKRIFSPYRYVWWFLWFDDYSESSMIINNSWNAKAAADERTAE